MANNGQLAGPSGAARPAMAGPSGASAPAMAGPSGAARPAMARPSGATAPAGAGAPASSVGSSGPSGAPAAATGGGAVAGGAPAGLAYNPSANTAGNAGSTGAAAGANANNGGNNSMSTQGGAPAGAAGGQTTAGAGGGAPGGATGPAAVGAGGGGDASNAGAGVGGGAANTGLNASGASAGSMYSYGGAGGGGGGGGVGGAPGGNSSYMAMQQAQAQAQAAQRGMYGGGGMGGYGGGGGAMQRLPMGYGGGGYKTTRPVTLDDVPVTAVNVTDTTEGRVTVFRSCAEVRRRFSVTVADVGFHVIRIEGFTDAVDADSLRASVRDACTIHEVSLVESVSVSGPVVEADAGAIEQQRSDLTQLRALRAKFEAAIVRSEKEMDLVERFAGKLTSVADVPSQHASRATLSKEYLQSFDEFVDLYQKRLADHDSRTDELRAKISDVDARISQLESEIAEEVTPVETVSRAVVILVHNLQPSVKDVNLTYFVSRATWAPLYTVRVSTDQLKANLTAAARLDFSCDAKVRQDTGEDWTNVGLILSNDAPPVTSAPPGASAVFVNLVENEESGGEGAGSSEPAASGVPSSDKGSLGKSGKRKRRRTRPKGKDAAGEPGSGVGGDDGDDSDYEFEYETGQGGTGFNLTLPRETTYTILSNNEDHVVSSALESLEAAFVCVATPRVSAKTFIRGTVLNSSNHPILAGTANVFLDSKFNGQTDMPASNPGESFEIFLGPNLSLAASYSVRKERTNEKKTIVERSVATMSIMTAQTIVPIRVLLQDPLPIPVDSSIKFKLLGPDVKSNNPIPVESATGTRVSLRPDNTLEVAFVATGTTITLPEITYTLEWPQSRQVTFA